MRLLALAAFRGYETPVAEYGSGSSAVVLVHGFGACAAQWRATSAALAESGRKVYALNLLGFGESEKPRLEYSIDLWAEQVAEFVESLEEPAALVGNSIGSLVCLAAATRCRPSAVALYNCAIGMNSKARPRSASEVVSWLFQAPFLLILDLVLCSPLAKPLFEKIADPETVRSILLLPGVYADPSRVDDALVEMIVAPARDDGALEAFVTILTGDPGPRPEDLVPLIQPDLPVAVLWGVKDQITPINGPIGSFFQNLPDVRPKTSFVALENTAHCPFDDRPDLATPPLLGFLDTYAAPPPPPSC
ncbi:hypothetical protein CTAYLR_004043 [Chrysophaeum taylorii]|uniref:AB hydrolase-1 domain-containing protein n=1 Tax=Chrysophaeum taylorii TaxID=2483200 RepID=A0AAD7UMN0_9STRA|nr:hypothetical protein CTAYLR_004043 [Chrysophaeum taylorii]